MGEERKMKSVASVLSIFALGLVFAGGVAADTLELKDGRVLQGRYLGGTQVVLRFEINGEVQTFKTLDLVALTFTAPPQAPPPAPASVDPQAQNPPSSAPPMPANNMAATQQSVPPAGYGVTIPAGQSMLVRMIDGVDSSKNNVGDVFHASLETDLNVNGALVARKGADIYGRLAEAKDAGHFSGSAELQLELVRIVIDGKDYPVVSSDYELKGKGRGGDTAKKVGGGAVAGAIIGAIAGGGRGAAIGTGVGAAAGAGVQVFTKGKQVKVPSETLLEFRLQQPVSVTPTQQ
jgi:hypothetical protein